MLIDMKKLILITLALLCCHAAFSQDIIPGYVTESKAAMLEETKGLFLKVENFERKVVAINEVEIIPAIITNIRTGEKTPYVIVKTKEEGTSIRYRSIIDYDEITSCIEALEHIMTAEITTTPSNDVHVFIMTRDALEIGARFEINAGIRKWKTTFTHGKYTTEPRTDILARNIKKLIEQLTSAKEVLDEKLK